VYLSCWEAPPSEPKGLTIVGSADQGRTPALVTACIDAGVEVGREASSPAKRLVTPLCDGVTEAG
jgi:hypothetical protein